MREGSKFVGEDEFTAYAVGLCTASACTSLKDLAQIELNMNASNPTGIGSRWKIAWKENFKTGENNPCPCNDKPNTHRHFLFHC